MSLQHFEQLPIARLVLASLAICLAIAGCGRPAPAGAPLGPTPRSGLYSSDPATTVLAAGKPQLVEFFAYWCPTCQALAPTINGLESEYSERVVFTALDIDDPANDPFKAELGYRVQPHLFLLDASGNVAGEWQGRVGRDTLSKAIDELLAESG